jgi:hypothetical protein
MNEVDSIRLVQFRQLKQGIRGSKEHLIIGIDVAKAGFETETWQK